MTVWVEIAGAKHRVELPAELSVGGEHECLVDGNNILADAKLIAPGVLSLLVSGCQYLCTLDGETLRIGQRTYPFTIDDPRSLRGRSSQADAASGPRAVKAPMPGRVVRILVAEGEQVEEHQGVIVIEAMKMQNELKAPRAGRISRIAVAAEDAVGTGHILVVIE
ncbi:MAG: acetyl-CoA carboxylase biotin carboxyl carrier protein subunit [Edaphobacter sp.]|uniref:acetyl-CoA carboxylase biotin carboxyl carrier protein subunit n=1 Tax=Edaphobacter sp. TaxID=1934404 RepID=UPI0023953607|nr:acetyl-CoA carboxylase biotin carboxyl carrier protein subunit [Edaphobacter sp.]MDE1178638.1 acetyl-CoA carboxylase biotin carboxyl carrier protein subunit [Edaphobacter sp.]